MIFGWADCRIGTYIIARRLTEMGVPPLTNAHRVKKPKIAGWSNGMVGALLRNVAVIGLWQPKKVTREREKDGKKEKLHYALRIKEGEAVPYYPPIIDPALFRRVGQGMEKRRKNDPVAAGGRRGRGFGRGRPWGGQGKRADRNSRVTYRNRGRDSGGQAERLGLRRVRPRSRRRPGRRLRAGDRRRTRPGRDQCNQAERAIPG